MGVPGDGGLGRCGRQKFVHFPNATDFVTRGIDGEDKDKDNREEHSSVGATLAKNLVISVVVSERMGTY